MLNLLPVNHEAGLLAGAGRPTSATAWAGYSTSQKRDNPAFFARSRAETQPLNKPTLDHFKASNLTQQTWVDTCCLPYPFIFLCAYASPDALERH